MQDWEQLRAPIAEMRQAGELVVVAPYWAEPQARRVLGDDAMPLEHVARPDTERFTQAIEISILGQDSEVSGWKLIDEQRVGAFRLRRFDNPNPDPPKLDLVDWVDSEHAWVASMRNKKDVQPCSWTDKAKVSNGALHGHPTFPKERFNCTRGGDWHFVGVTAIEDQNYRPRRCIWAHPAPGRKTAVRFKNVPLGSKIVGYGGLSYFLERDGKGAPIKLQLRVAGKKIDTWTHDDGEGWKRFEFSTEQYAGQNADVEFRVYSKSAHHREFCFQADVR